MNDDEPSPQAPAPDRGRRGGALPWVARLAAGGAKALGIGSLPGSLPGLLVALGLVGGIIAGTAVIGTMLGHDRRYKLGLAKSGRRAAHSLADVKTDAAPGALPGDGAPGAGSLGMVAGANQGAMHEGSASADAAAQARQAGSAGQEAPEADASSSGRPGAEPDGANKPSAAPGLKKLDPFVSVPRGGSGGAGGGGYARAGGGAGVSAPEGADAGKLLAFSRGGSASPGKAAVAPVGKSAVRRGANLKRLDEMNRAMKPTTRMDGQQAAAAQTAAWERRPAPARSVAGGGAGTPAGGAAGSRLDGPSGDAGGPVPGAARPTAPAANVPDADGGEDVTPWGNMIQWATALIAAAGVLLAIAGLLSLFQWSAAYGIAKVLCYAALALAAIVALLGIAIMAQGQTRQGLIFMVAGTIISAIAYITAEAFDPKSQAVESAVKEGVRPEAAQIKADLGKR